MSDILLVGAGAVREAGNTIHRAAEQMGYAASTFGEYVMQLTRALEDHAQRMERVAERIEKVAETFSTEVGR